MEIEVSVPSRGLSILIDLKVVVNMDNKVSVPSRGLSILIVFRFNICRYRY